VLSAEVLKAAEECNLFQQKPGDPGTHWRMAPWKKNKEEEEEKEEEAKSNVCSTYIN